MVTAWGWGSSIYGPYGDVLLNRVWFLPLSAICHSDSGGDYFAARIALQMKIVAVPTRVLLLVYSNTPFPVRKSTASHIFLSGAGHLFSRFCLEQGSKIVSL